MKRRRDMYQIIFIAALFSLTAGCIKDNSDCDRIGYVRLTVVDAQHKDITHLNEVASASIYVYSSSGQFLRVIPVSDQQIKEKTIINIGEVSPKGVYLSVWGNQSQNQELSKIDKGTSILESVISLKKDVDGYALNPDNLFFAFQKITDPTQTSTIPIAPKNAKIYVTVRGLTQTMGDDKFFFVIRQNNNGYNFKGEPFSGSSAIKLQGVFNSKNDFVMTPAANSIHYTENKHTQGNELIVSLFDGHNTKEPLATVITDHNGDYMIPKAGETINVLIHIKTGNKVDVYLVITPWNIVHWWSAWEN